MHLGEEMSDVFMCVAASPSWSNTPPIHQNLPSAGGRYLVRLADKCDVDLSAAVQRKLQRNAEKYPADRCRGSSAKYTEYAGAAAPSAES